MDFTKLLKHCEAEHGIQVDTSAFTEAILNSIFAFFAAHGEILTHTQLWDIFETLQESPKPGNPPPIMLGSVIGGERANLLLEILKDLKETVSENLKSGEPLRPASWYTQEGVLLHNQTARDICDIFDELFKGVNAPEQLPDPVIYPRPDWDKIDTKFNWVAADADKDVYAFAEKPQFRGGLWSSGGEYEYLHEINFGKMLWQRPKKLEKQPSEQTEKVAEITPDYGTGFRPDWDAIDPEYVACAVDKGGQIFIYKSIPEIDEDTEEWLHDWRLLGLKLLLEIKAPVENWRECLWIRPGYQQQ